MIHWRVNVGWCGGEFAIESYMHNDLETLRSTIIPSTTQCNEAELDGTISITTPTYGSIQPLDLKLKLQGGVGNSMFQPSGFSRPDSWCKGYPFLPPKNVDDAIEYVDYRAHYEKKQLWPTEEIRRAVVTYRFTAQVQKTQGYIVDEGKSLILPNTLVITRDRNVEIIIKALEEKEIPMRWKVMLMSILEGSSLIGPKFPAINANSTVR